MQRFPSRTDVVKS